MAQEKRFHFGGREFLPQKIKDLKLEEPRRKGNFNLHGTLIGFRKDDGELLINGLPLSGAMAASIRDMFKWDQVPVHGTWVFYPDEEYFEGEDEEDADEGN